MPDQDNILIDTFWLCYMYMFYNNIIRIFKTKIPKTTMSTLLLIMHLSPHNEH